MSATDTAALTERIAKPIEQELCSRWMDTDDFAEEWVDPGRPQRLMFCDEHDTITRPGDRCPEAIRIAVAVLPIVEAEVRAAKAEALREAAERARRDLGWENGGHTSTYSVRHWLRGLATGHEKGGSDERR